MAYLKNTAKMFYSKYPWCLSADNFILIESSISTKFEASQSHSIIESPPKKVTKSYYFLRHQLR